jgi:hypothetical protein
MLKSFEHLQKVPRFFALKELNAPKVFHVGQGRNLQECLPLDEGAIMQYVRHAAIVDTYWADVRCLHPETNEPIGVDDMEGLHEPGHKAGISSWTPLGDLNRLERATRSFKGPRRLKFIKVQMRIAMELCDMGAVLTCIYSIPAIAVEVDMPRTALPCGVDTPRRMSQ